jgi:hypothetical protein
VVESTEITESEKLEIYLRQNHSLKVVCEYYSFTKISNFDYNENKIFQIFEKEYNPVSLKEENEKIKKENLKLKKKIKNLSDIGSGDKKKKAICTCGRSFATTSNLNRHINSSGINNKIIHKKINNKDEIDFKSFDELKEKITKLEIENKKLREELIIQTNKSILQLYKCTFCGRELSNNSNKTRHEKKCSKNPNREK